MPFDVNGFLGKDALIMSSRIKERHKEIVELCYEINRFAQEVRLNLEISKDDKRELFSSLFFIRILEGAQAVIILAEKGLEEEVATILRAVFEAQVYLILCSQNPDFVKRYLTYSEILTKKALHTILEDKYYEKEGLHQEDIENRIKEIDDKFLKEGIKPREFEKSFSKKELAKEAGQADVYKYFYQVTSGSAHTGLTALTKYIALNEKKDIIQLNHGPSDKDAKEYFVTVAEFMLGALTCINHIFEKGLDEKISFFRNRLNKFNR